MRGWARVGVIWSPRCPVSGDGCLKEQHWGGRLDGISSCVLWSCSGHNGRYFPTMLKPEKEEMGDSVWHLVTVGLWENSALWAASPIWTMAEVQAGSTRCPLSSQNCHRGHAQNPSLVPVSVFCRWRWQNWLFFSQVSSRMKEAGSDHHLWGSFFKTTQSCAENLKTCEVEPFSEGLRGLVRLLGHTFLIVPIFDDSPV